MNANTLNARTRYLHSDVESPAKRPERNQAPALFSKSLNRLMSAAVVSPRFCRLLLSDPVSALAAGYNGERFQLTPEEVRLVCSIRTTTVRGFAAQLVERIQEPVVERRVPWAVEAGYELRDRIGLGQGRDDRSRESRMIRDHI